MKKKRKKSIGTLPRSLTSKSKWAKRGRDTAHFTMSLLFGVSSYIVDAGITAGKEISKTISGRRKKFRKEKVGKAVQTGQAQDQPFVPLTEKPKVSFRDVAGLDKAKEQIIQRMVLPTLHPYEAEVLKVKKGGGILLFGPPGTGKTILAKAVANQIEANFFHIKPADIVRSGVGQAEARLAKLFQTLKKYKKAVLFFDDVDGLLPSRTKNSSTIMRRVISQYLVETDGLEGLPLENTLLIIGTTNEPEMIDPAVKRAGRFDARIYVGLPEKPARMLILGSQLKGRPIASDLDLNELAEITEGYSGADLVELVNRAVQRTFSRNIKRKKDEEISPISQVDFQIALREVKPSVSQKDLKKYQKFEK